MKVGRPTKFTQENVEKLFYAIRKGAPYSHACHYAKISVALFCEWKERAKNGEPDFVEFMEQLKKAEAETSIHWLDKIDKAMADGAWQAAAWKLERRYPETYGRDAAAVAEAKEMNKKLDKLIVEKESNNGKDVHSESN